MGKKRKKGKNSSKSRIKATHEAASTQTGPDSACVKVRELIAAGSERSALKLAKDLVKSTQNEETEAVLLEAYLARIRALIDKNLGQEAVALIQLVETRYPGVRSQLESLRSRGVAVSGALDELVAPLAREIDSNERERIERTIANDLKDPGLLANCDALPVSHPLRAAAIEVRDAFEKVCNGPVDKGELVLRGVSRRSPLAPWKLLIRAIASFYERNDAQCLDLVDRIPEDSAPGRLAPVLAVLCGRDTDLGEAGSQLKHLIQSNDSALCRQLERFEAAAYEGLHRDPIPILQKALRLCEKQRPDLHHELEQRIAARFVIEGVSPCNFEMAFGFKPLANARFWQVSASLMEAKGNQSQAVQCWALFHLHAIAEEWFPGDSPVAAALLMHMAGLAGRAGRTDYDSFYETLANQALILNLEDIYAGQPVSVQAVYEAWPHRNDPDALTPTRLFQRACELDPKRENFHRWHRESQHAGRREQEAVLTTWAEMRPTDPEPLVMLADAAEKRNALKKALEYLNQAEAREALDPRVRTAKFRLWCANAVRHYRAGKPHLMEKDLAALAELDASHERGRDAICAAFEWTVAAHENDAERQQNCIEQMASILNGELGVNLLLSCLKATVARKIAWPLGKPSAKVFKEADTVVAAVAQVAHLTTEAAFPFVLPGDTEDRLIKALKRKKPPGNPGDLLRIARRAVDEDMGDLAYCASGAGIHLGGEMAAFFLIVRAQTLPRFDFSRRAFCLAAALKLGERAGNPGIRDEAMQTFDSSGQGVFLGRIEFDSALKMSVETAETIRKIERDLRDQTTRVELPYSTQRKYDKVSRELGCDTLGKLFGDMSGIGWDEEDEDDYYDDEPDIIQEIRDFIIRRTHGSKKKLNFNEFMNYCNSVPKLREEWTALMDRYEAEMGEVFNFKEWFADTW